MSAKPKLLVLFPKDWDRLHYAQPHLANAYDVSFLGFDLFRFPENLRLLAFDAERFIDRCVDQCRRQGIAGVISNHEPLGAMIAAGVTERLGLPGAGLRAIMIAQHKLAARQVLRRALPEAMPPFAGFEYTVDDPARFPLPFPCFVKPVKATFSVLARRVENFEQVREHLAFGPLELFLIRRLTRPFNALLRHVPEITVDADRMIAEGLIDGQAVSLDGYVENGAARTLGIVDEHMYPGTDAFSHFEYPSRLPPSVQARIAAVAERAIAAIGFKHGFFNVELTYDWRHDSITIIEINPRMASQMMSLYADAAGIDGYVMEAELALGRSPPPPRPRAYPGAAGSFAFRRFDDRPARHPTPAQLARLAAEYPDARLMLYVKHGSGLRRELKWMGSHRYAVINLGGRDRDDLHARVRAIARLLGFDREEPQDFARLAAAAAPIPVAAGQD